tara:strand:+ start:1227 stop:1631 length:405 start_codon:yes stop_codon:yes gene_type:complete
MKSLITLFALILCTASFMGSTTQNNDSVVREVPPVPIILQEPDLPEVLDIKMSKYPPPLDMMGRHKYHILINNKLVSMSEDQVEEICDQFSVELYEGKDFYEQGLDSFGIWAQPQLTNIPPKKSTRPKRWADSQ